MRQERRENTSQTTRNIGERARDRHARKYMQKRNLDLRQRGDHSKSTDNVISLITFPRNRCEFTVRFTVNRFTRLFYCVSGVFLLRVSPKFCYTQLNVFHRGFHAGLPLTSPCKRCNFCHPYVVLSHTRSPFAFSTGPRWVPHLFKAAF